MPNSSTRIDEWGEHEFADCAYHLAMEVFAKDGWADPVMDAYDARDPRLILNLQGKLLG